MRKALLVLLFGIYLAVLFDLTLLQYRQTSRGPGSLVNFVPVVTIIHFCRIGGREFVVNVLGNLAAMAPLGMLMRAWWGRRVGYGWIALASFALSAVVESLQFASGCRVADVDDLLLNTIGGMLGAGILDVASGLSCLLRARVVRFRRGLL